MTQTMAPNIPQVDTSKPLPTGMEQPQKYTPQQTVANKTEDSVLAVIKGITEIMQKQQLFFEKRSIDSEGQIGELLGTLIKEQKKRDIDPQV